MTASRFPDAPARIAALPVDHRGFPVPWFVSWADGVPDFRIVGRGRVKRALAQSACWICGERLGRHLAFVIGPMCAVNRVSAEPPSHYECASFSVRACPFLSQPLAKRNERGLPEERVAPPGQMILRNPGVALVWVTESFKLLRDGRGGTLIEIGPPRRVDWVAQGRAATRAEVLASIEGGYPLLLEAALKDGPAGVRELERLHAEALQLIPA